MKHRSTIRSISTRFSSSPLFAAALIFALLWAQWLGFEHAILHGGVSNHGSASHGIAAIFEDAPDSSEDGSDRRSLSGHHSCAAFEGATLASGAPSAARIDLSCSLANVRHDRVIPEFYLPLFAALFNSRAPPQLPPPA